MFRIFHFHVLLLGFFAAVAAGLGMGVPQAHAQEQATVSASQDTYIKRSTSSTNFSQATVLEGSRYKLGSDQEQKVIMLGFDLAEYADMDVVDAQLRFEAVELDSSISDSYGIRSKAIKLYPHVDLSSITFNSFLATKLARPDLTLNLDYGVGEHIPSANPTLLSYEYPYIHTFILHPTNGNQELESSYRAAVNSAGGRHIVTVPLGESLKELGGSSFTLHLNNQRGKDLKIYSLESVDRQKPELIVTLAPKTPSVDISEFVVSEQELCTQQPSVQNGMTGLHEWRGSSYNPTAASEADVYERFYWSDLESTQGNYQGIAASIGSKLQNLEPGQKFAFRIRAMDTALQVPSYVANHSAAVQTCSGATVPNWNDPFFIERAELLLAAVSDYIVTEGYEDRVSWVEIGFTGKWGETNGACVESITQENLERYVAMYTQNFPYTRLLSMTDDSRIAAIALNAPAGEKGVMGVRRDSMGGDSHRFAETAVNFESFHLIKDRWKVAPFTAEFGGSAINLNGSMWDLSLLELAQFNVTSVSNGNTVTGRSNKNPFVYADMPREQSIFTEIGQSAGARFALQSWGHSGDLNTGSELAIYTSWLNQGNAPAYEAYSANLVFRHVTTGQEQSYPLSVDFTTILPTTNRVTGAVQPMEQLDSVMLPEEGGEYQVLLSVQDADEQSSWPRNPMQLCNAAQQEDLRYALGTLNIIKPILINFERPASETPAGYLKDDGAIYGNRPNGMTYGWSSGNKTNARERNAGNSPDERHDTLNHMMLNGNRSWQIAVPNGTYEVSITAGDPSYFDSVYKISAEGIAVVAGTPTSESRFVSGVATVTVADGKLTVKNMTGASNNKINFIKIVPISE